MTMLSKEEINDLLFRTLLWCKADVSLLSLVSHQKSFLNYNENGVLSGGEISDSQLTIKARIGSREGMAQTNQFDEESLKKAVKKAEFSARAAAPNRELTIWSRKSKTAQRRSFNDSKSMELTAINAEQKADLLYKGFRAIKDNNVLFNGSFSHDVRREAIQATQGLSAFHQESNYDFSTTIRSKRTMSTGWAFRCGNDIDVPNFLPEVDRARRRSVHLGRRPAALRKGSYPVILEPAATGALIGAMIPHFNARLADTGRSFLSRQTKGNRLGEQLFSRRIHLFSDPFLSELPSLAWDAEGYDVIPLELIKEGKINSLFYPPYWGMREKNRVLPMPTNCIMRGMNQSLEQLIADTERGVLISRISCLKEIDTRRLMVSGTSSHGTFWIENGKIKYPLSDVPIQVSLVQLLRNVDTLTHAVKVPSSNGLKMLMPGLRVKAVTFPNVPAVG